MGIKWSAQIICNICGKDKTDGPSEIGPRDEISIGSPPDGWIRIDISTSEKVLPKQMDHVVEMLNSNPDIPPETINAQREAMEMSCPEFMATFDLCETCQAKEGALGLLAPLLIAEQKRQLELVSEEFDENVIEVVFPSQIQEPIGDA